MRHLDSNRPPRVLVSAGGMKLPLGLFALGLSVAGHTAVFTFFSVINWTVPGTSTPKIVLPKGEDAVEVLVIATPWPKPHEEIEVTDPPSNEVMERLPAQPPEKSEQEVRDAEKVQSDPAEREPVQSPDPPLPAPEVSMELDTTDRAPESIVQDRVDSETKMERQRELKQSPVPTAEPAPPKPQTVTAETKPAEPRPSPPSSVRKQGVSTGIEVINLPQPVYPLVSRRRGEQGIVVLDVEVRANGATGSIKVVTDPGHDRLIEAAIEAARSARFLPATRNGAPVPDTVRIPFRFELR